MTDTTRPEGPNKAAHRRPNHSSSTIVNRMATQRNLARPPISEALVDLRTSAPQPEQAFKDLAERLKPRFPKFNTSQTFQTQMGLKDGKMLPTQGEVAFRGVQLRNEDETLAVQFRVDGFTLNNLSRYIGGDQLLAEAASLWADFVRACQPAGVNRIALRYINKLELPIQAGDDFTKFLTSPPDMPPGCPESVSEFLIRVVAHEPDSPGLVVITQRLTHEEGKAIIYLDIDASEQGDFGNEPKTHGVVLGRLRELKNRVFFSLITDETAKLYS